MLLQQHFPKTQILTLKIEPIWQPYMSRSPRLALWCQIGPSCTNIFKMLFSKWTANTCPHLRRSCSPSDQTWWQKHKTTWWRGPEPGSRPAGSWRWSGGRPRNFSWALSAATRRLRSCSRWPWWWWWSTSALRGKDAEIRRGAWNRLQLRFLNSYAGKSANLPNLH